MKYLNMGGIILKSRQLEILVYLLKNKKTTYGQLAKKFEVSTKTIERDIDCLSSMGIPVYCTQGIGGGVHIDGSYKFTSSFFTPEDIHHIVLALKVMDSFSKIHRKDAIIQKLCLISPELTAMFEHDMQNYLSIDLVEEPVDTENEICKTINYCLDEEMLATIDGVDGVACISYVLKADGLYLFAYKEDYILMPVKEIINIECSQLSFLQKYLSYEEYKNSR